MPEGPLCYFLFSFWVFFSFVLFFVFFETPRLRSQTGEQFQLEVFEYNPKTIGMIQHRGCDIPDPLGFAKVNFAHRAAILAVAFAQLT